MNKNKFGILSFLIILIFPTCNLLGEVNVYTENINSVLESAGDNRDEFEKVLYHYRNAGDSLKLQAAEFLISNMEGHCYVTYNLVDTTGGIIDFDVLDYENYDLLTSAADKLEKKHGVLDFDKDVKKYDAEVITAEFLIIQIEYAFKAWREKPWSRQIGFLDFCEYILPYRGSNEPLEEWRKYFWDKYLYVDTMMSDSTDPIEAAGIINNDIMSWFGFDPRFYYHPTDQGLSEMIDNGLGRCEDMTNVTIYAMRANGLAVTSDYTPYWANSGNNHAWNAIVTPDGRAIPFMGAEANPGQYKLANKLGKAYRKTFGKQMENLTFQVRKQEKIPGWLAGKNYKDVTAQYVKVCDVNITFEEDIDDSIDVAYLCVFNSGEWKPIHWGWIDNKTALFTDMGTDIVYLPALYINEEIVPFGSPFILSENCDIISLQNEYSDTVSIELISTTSRKLDMSTDGIDKSFLEPGVEYELFYWKNDWLSLGSLVAKDKPIVIEYVPSGHLYWLVAKDSDKEERIFTFEDGRQIWW